MHFEWECNHFGRFFSKICQRCAHLVGLLPGIYLTKCVSCIMKGRYKSVYHKNLVTTQMSVNRTDFVHGDIMQQ